MTAAIARVPVKWAIIGRARGALFVTFFGALWLGISTFLLGTLWGVVAIALVGVILAALCVREIRSARSMDATPPTEEERAFSRRLGRRFGLIFGVEIGSIALADAILIVFGWSNYITAATAFIVGVHFFPVARLFAIPFYYILGALIGAAALLAAVLLQPPARDLTVGFVTGILLWATTIYLLATIRRTKVGP